MCWLSNTHKELVEREIGNRLAIGEPFTGYEVQQVLREQGHDVPEVSAYVRECFNAGRMEGWASTQVVPRQGPVLYFKVTPSMKAAKVAATIRSKLANC
jgi:hypothetical protein